MASIEKTPWVVFDYERHMFSDLLGVANGGNPLYLWLPRCLQMACVESLLLHMREVMEILLSSGSRTDDIKLCSLLPGFAPPMIADLGERYGKPGEKGRPCHTLNKMLMHPTLLRGSSYDYTRLVADMAPAILSCLQAVGGERERRGLGGDPRTSTEIKLPEGERPILGHFGTEWGP